MELINLEQARGGVCIKCWPPPKPGKKEDPGKQRAPLIYSDLRSVFLLASFLGYSFNNRSRLLTFRTACQVVFLVSGSMFGFLTIYQCLGGRRSFFHSIGTIQFYLVGSYYQFYFLCLSLRWKSLAAAWQAVDKRMIGLPQVPISKTIYAVTIIYLFTGLTEHGLSIINNRRIVIQSCSASNLTTMELYYKLHYSMLFGFTDYKVWKGIVTSVVILKLTVSWMYTDIFLITVPFALSARFKQLKLALLQADGKEKPKDWWKEVREIYLDLSVLTKQLDDNISLLLFFSLVNNIYVIIIVLLNALRWKSNNDLLELAYYLVCVLFVIMRLAGTCSCAAKVNEQSKDFLVVLFAVPTNSYYLEVHRLMLHAWYNPSSLTAFKFFSITWSTILKIAGSVFTYESLLVQFDQLNSEENRSSKIDCPH